MTLPVLRFGTRPRDPSRVITVVSSGQEGSRTTHDYRIWDPVTGGKPEHINILADLLLKPSKETLESVRALLRRRGNDGSPFVYVRDRLTNRIHADSIANQAYWLCALNKWSFAQQEVQRYVDWQAQRNWVLAHDTLPTHVWDNTMTWRGGTAGDGVKQLAREIDLYFVATPSITPRLAAELIRWELDRSTALCESLRTRIRDAGVNCNTRVGRYYQPATVGLMIDLHTKTTQLHYWRRHVLKKPVVVSPLARRTHIPVP